MGDDLNPFNIYLSFGTPPKRSRNKNLLSEQKDEHSASFCVFSGLQVKNKVGLDAKNRAFDS
jgi:hypothetical protein